MSGKTIRIIIIIFILLAAVGFSVFTTMSDNSYESFMENKDIFI